MRTRVLILVGFCFISVAATSRGGDWPQFRGPGGAGVASEKNLPTEWGTDKNVLWKAEIAGTGWSQPIVWGDKVFITSASTDKQTKPRPGGGFGGKPGGGGGFGKPGRPPDVLYRYELYCLDRGTGKVLWKELALEAKPKITTHSSNTYATETPVTDGERVYAYFGMAGLFCYDFTGKLVWKADLGAYNMQLGYGTASSPVLEGDRLFIQCDNEQKSFLVALDKKDGKELWRVSRSERSTWTTPCIWKNKERTELVASGSKVRSYDLTSGKVLWELNIGGGMCSASPVADEERLYVGSSAGRGFDTGGGGLYAVKAGASGDISLKRGETSNDGVAWSQPRGGPAMASPVVHKGYIYILQQMGGMVSCYDAQTGKPAYQRERITGARAFWASPWAHEDKIFCMDEEGQTFMLKAGAEFKVLGKNTLKDMFWASPAVAGETIILRGVDKVYCIKQ